MTERHALIILLGFVFTALFLVILIIYQKMINQRQIKLQGLARDYLFKKYFDSEDVTMPFSGKFFFDAYIDIETQVQIESSVRERVITDLMLTRFCKKQFKRLSSFNPIKRKIAAFYVGALESEQAIDALKSRILFEKDDSVRFYLIYQLKKHMSKVIFDSVMESLIGSSEAYQKWIRTLLNNEYGNIKNYLDHYFNRKEAEIISCLIELASKHSDLNLMHYALDIFNHLDFLIELRLKALKAVSKMHPDQVFKDIYYQHEIGEVRKIAIKSGAEVVKKESLYILVSLANGDSLDDEIVESLSRITYESKNLLLYLVESYPKVIDLNQRKVYAKVLAHRIDYLVLKLKSDGLTYVKQILDDILALHIVEDFIDFVNKNKDVMVEKDLLNLIKKHMVKDDYLLNQFSIYLDQNILSKLGMMKKAQPVIQREKAPVEKNKIVFIISWITFSIIIFPLIFLLSNFSAIFSGNLNILTSLVVHINRYLVIYFLSVNSIYLLLLMLSIKGSRERLDLWQIKKQTLLFEHDLMPSISIIAPAYNEELSIIESITSLLNLKYPKYEVIVVNDGSKDQTIDVLIEHFKLERKHPFFKERIKTRPLRGVYINKLIPNLIVIDKVNGGKADALNLGINAAKNDYICGIDADSLLEEDALLKLTSITLDSTVEHIALGGNIVPVNGCVVDKGKIDHQGLGKKEIVRFQTLEYLRAFTTGRIGWAKLRSLMIISGAFGLFNRKSLIDTGGYLTISGQLKKDTVGEDMELVVRLTHQALLKKKKYRVEYVHHANCYTELPSDLKTLLKQRNRWQRGLLDILSYHRRMLFNPKYKQPGLIAFPYFFIYEMIGPFLEMIGYLALLAGLFLGILNTGLVLLLIAVTIGYGMVISLFSLWIAERKNQFYSNKETMILIFTAIIENFGYRQLMSLHRVASTFSAIREKGAWGTQKRQGFVKQ
jgi:peptidoglycan-N-acetylglucosamine deacetylase